MAGVIYQWKEFTLLYQKNDGYNDGFNFHYCKPDEVKQGQFTEKHHLKKERRFNVTLKIVN